MAWVWCRLVALTGSQTELNQAHRWGGVFKHHVAWIKTRMTSNLLAGLCQTWDKKGCRGGLFITFEMNHGLRKSPASKQSIALFCTTLVRCSISFMAAATESHCIQALRFLNPRLTTHAILRDFNNGRTATPVSSVAVFTNYGRNFDRRVKGPITEIQTLGIINNRKLCKLIFAPVTTHCAGTHPGKPPNPSTCAWACSLESSRSAEAQTRRQSVTYQHGGHDLKGNVYGTASYDLQANRIIRQFLIDMDTKYAAGRYLSSPH